MVYPSNTSPYLYTWLLLHLLVGFFVLCCCLNSNVGAVVTLTPVNYKTQTLEGFHTNFELVEAKYAYMLSPTGICVGLDGDVFVADAERHLVFRIFNNLSVVEVYAGYVTNGFNGDGLKAVGTLLNSPTAVSVNPLNGDLFIADSLNNKIRIVSNRTRTTSSIAHTFNNPRGVFVSPNGFVYISDTDNNLIKKYEISTTQISIIGGGGYLNGDHDGVDAKLLKLQSPKNIFVVSNGNKDIVYFTDAERVKSIDENGKYRIVDGGVAQSNL